MKYLSSRFKFLCVYSVLTRCLCLPEKGKVVPIKLDNLNIFSPYREAEADFISLIKSDNLDARILAKPEDNHSFNEKLNLALDHAFLKGEGDDSAHIFVQRCLYHINRLKLFWYDDLKNYSNENSWFLFNTRSKIEKRWSAWEENQISNKRLHKANITQALCKRTEEDLNPELSDEDKYICNEISETGYRRLIAIASLDGLVEASQLSRVLGGAGSDVQLMLTRILWEEYGGGKLKRKHSSYFAKMLEELDLDSRPEAYLGIVPWEVLANINHSFMLSEQKRKFLRYVGGLLFIEVSVPASFKNNKLAGERLGLSDEAISYWTIHIEEDIRHGQWMLNDVALPLVEKYPEDAWELVMGYDQQKFLSARAKDSIVASIQKYENELVLV